MNLARKGKQFEQAYKWLYDLDKDKYTVTSPAYLYDPFAERKREIDVLVEFKDSDNITRKMAIECRDRTQNQDVMWIEQLQQKKEDLSLDCILATTTADFTSSAIKKAKRHGVIIEKAETLNSEKFTEIISDKYFCDVYFVKLSFERLEFFTKEKRYITYKELINSLSFLEQSKMINELNHNYYYSINPVDYLKRGGIKQEAFFKNNEDNSMLINNALSFIKHESDVMSSNGIVAIRSTIRIVPFKLSLTLNNSISVFEVENKENKKYRASFGNEEDSLEVGYIENQIYSNWKFKDRKYFRVVGGIFHLNTIFPEKSKESKWKLNNIEELIGEFDFSKII